MNRNTRFARNPVGSAIVLTTVATLILILALGFFVLNYTSTLGSDREATTAAEAAALTAAKDISRIAIVTPLGQLGVSDFPANDPNHPAKFQANMDAGEKLNENQPVIGVNTALATLRLDYLIAKEAQCHQLQKMIAGDKSKDGQDELSRLKVFVRQLSQAVQDRANSKVIRDKALQTYMANEQRLGKGKLIPDSFKLTIGVLSKGGETNIPIPVPADATAIMHSNHGKYRAYEDIKADGMEQAIVLSGISDRPRLVDTSTFFVPEKTTASVPFTVVKVDADNKITLPAVTQEGHSQTLHCSAAAEAGTASEKKFVPPSTIMTVGFSGFYLPNTAFTSKNVTLAGLIDLGPYPKGTDKSGWTPSGGVPTWFTTADGSNEAGVTGSTTLTHSSGPKDLSDVAPPQEEDPNIAIARGTYHWLRSLGLRPRIDATATELTRDLYLLGNEDELDGKRSFFVNNPDLHNGTVGDNIQHLKSANGTTPKGTNDTTVAVTGCIAPLGSDSDNNVVRNQPNDPRGEGGLFSQDNNKFKDAYTHAFGYQLPAVGSKSAPLVVFDTKRQIWTGNYAHEKDYPGAPTYWENMEHIGLAADLLYQQASAAEMIEECAGRCGWNTQARVCTVDWPRGLGGAEFNDDLLTSKGKGMVDLRFSRTIPATSTSGPAKPLDNNGNDAEPQTADYLVNGVLPFPADPRYGENNYKKDPSDRKKFDPSIKLPDSEIYVANNNWVIGQLLRNAQNPNSATRVWSNEVCLLICARYWQEEYKKDSVSSDPVAQHNAPIEKGIVLSTLEVYHKQWLPMEVRVNVAYQNGNDKKQEAFGCLNNFNALCSGGVEVTLGAVSGQNDADNLNSPEGRIWPSRKSQKTGDNYQIYFGGFAGPHDAGTGGEKKDGIIWPATEIYLRYPRNDNRPTIAGTANPYLKNFLADFGVGDEDKDLTATPIQPILDGDLKAELAAAPNHFVTIFGPGISTWREKKTNPAAFAKKKEFLTRAIGSPDGYLIGSGARYSTWTTPYMSHAGENLQREPDYREATASLPADDLARHNSFNKYIESFAEQIQSNPKAAIIPAFADPSKLTSVNASRLFHLYIYGDATTDADKAGAGWFSPKYTSNGPFYAFQNDNLHKHQYMYVGLNALKTISNPEFELNGDGVYGHYVDGLFGDDDVISRTTYWTVLVRDQQVNLDPEYATADNDKLLSNPDQFVHKVNGTSGASPFGAGKNSPQEVCHIKIGTPLPENPFKYVSHDDRDGNGKFMYEPLNGKHDIEMGVAKNPNDLCPPLPGNFF